MCGYQNVDFVKDVQWDVDQELCNYIWWCKYSGQEQDVNNGVLVIFVYVFWCDDVYFSQKVNDDW